MSERLAVKKAGAVKRNRVVFLTGHFPIQKRKGSISWLVDFFRQDNWSVIMVTVGYSWISWVKGDKRFDSLYDKPEFGEKIHDETLTSVFELSPIHPFSLRNAILDKVVRPLHVLFRQFWRPRLARIVKDADLVVIESGPPIVLADIVREYAPDAKLIYRVNDDVKVLGLPEFLIEKELEVVPLFDRISVTSPILAKRFEALSTSVHNDPVGVNKSILDKPHPDPFQSRDRAEREVVCAGTTLFDLNATIAMARLRPTWNFHILGRLKPPRIPLPENLILHGELPYEVTAGWIKYADIGLAPYLNVSGIEYQIAQSNRILMYRYFGLPIIGPERIADASIPSFVGYDIACQDSLERALEQAGKLPRNTENNGVHDWSELYSRISSEVIRANTLKSAETASDDDVRQHQRAST